VINAHRDRTSRPSTTRQLRNMSRSSSEPPAAA
jgi:hypothetical protein